MRALRPTLTDSPEFCGPNELAEAIIGVRETYERELGSAHSSRSSISDDGIRRLIKIAFWTSCAAEEGRYPRVRVITADAPWSTDGAFDAAILDTPIAGVDSLRRLAPIATDSEMALVVTEADSEEFRCTGLKIVGGARLGVRPGSPSPGGVQIGNPSFSVRIEGPGRLRVTEHGHSTLLLDGGQIHEVVDSWHVPVVRQLWMELAARIIEKLDIPEGSTSALRHAQSSWFHIHEPWSHVLSTAVDKRHGGAFVIIPKANGTARPEEFYIRCKYQTTMRFGEGIRDLWQCCLDQRLMSKDYRERRSAEHAWEVRYENVFSQARILAGLSSVDGCVVLDRDLNVLGFGGEIRINELQDESDVNQMGTRHRSAYRLVKTFPGVIMFIISQDGDLRLFCSDAQGEFHWYEGLHAWVHDHESQ